MSSLSSISSITPILPMSMDIEIESPVQNKWNWNKILEITRDGNQEESQILPNEPIFKTLQENFHPDLVKLVLNRYGLNKEEPLTLGNLRAILIGIGANVKHDHVVHRHGVDPFHHQSDPLNHFRQILPSEAISNTAKNDQRRFFGESAIPPEDNSKKRLWETVKIIAMSILLAVGTACLVLGTLAFLASPTGLAIAAIAISASAVALGIILGISLIVQAIRDHKEKTEKLASEENKKLENIVQLPVPMEIENNVPKHCYNRQFEEDLNFLRTCSEVNTFFHIDEHLNQEIASSEYLSQIAYQKLRTGMIVPIIQPNGCLAHHQVDYLIDKEGIGWFILAPIEGNSSTQEGDIHVICRGTDQTNIESIRRDFEPYAAGQYSAATNAPNLLNALKKTIKKIDTEKVRIIFSGHSLGAADSAHLTERLVTAIATCKNKPKMIINDNPENEIAEEEQKKVVEATAENMDLDNVKMYPAEQQETLLKISSITANLFNGPGVSPATNLKMLNAVEILGNNSMDYVQEFEKEQKELMEIEESNPKGPLMIHINHIRREGDPVQRFGGQAFGTGLEELEADNVAFKIFQVNGGHKSKVLSVYGIFAHMTRTFPSVAMGDSVEYRYADSRDRGSIDILKKWSKDNFLGKYNTSPKFQRLKHHFGMNYILPTLKKFGICDYHEPVIE